METELAPRAPKIDPRRRPSSAPPRDPGRPGNPALPEWEAAGLDAPDLAAMRRYRLDRLRAELARRDVAGAVLYDPLNIRYATDTSNMQVWCLHNAARYCFVATDGPVVLFDFHGCGHLSADFDTVDETRGAVGWYYFGAGPEEAERAEVWAAEIADLVRAHGGANSRLLLDRCDRLGSDALERQGVSAHVSMAFAEEARKIKHPEEIKAMRRAVHAAETGMAAMWAALRPGITENQLWSVLHAENIARGGEWIETRLLSSGPRTNPWFQECSDRVIERGDIVSFDTDLIGPYGYCCDISRAWVTPEADGAPVRPSNEQAELHAIAEEQIAFNMDAFRPGMSHHEFQAAAFQLPPDLFPNRYSALVHGIGLCDEAPHVTYPGDHCYDGVIEPGMVICFESYIGRAGGKEGVKLERQTLVTDTGLEVLDRFPVGLVSTGLVPTG